MTDPSLDDVLAALHASCDRLAATVAALSDEQVAGPSYDDGWTVGQVASHLGSQAEIFGLFVEAGRTGEAAPGTEVFTPIWDAWNAKPPARQAHDTLAADTAFLARVDALDADERAAWRLDLFGAEQDLRGLLRMRLAEHTLHSWDIVVASDPGATLAAEAAGIVLGSLPGLAARVGRPADPPRRVHVRTTSPERAFVLGLTAEGADLTRGGADDEAGEPTLDLPAEALVRLVYGRLDTAHTPAAVRVSGIGLDELRSAFPGV